LDLWREYKETGRRELRDELILRYLPLVKYVAARVAAGLPPVGHAVRESQEDLEQYGVFGLIDAIEKFDIDRGIKFESYAVLRIRGAIIDELRSLDWVPRSVRFRAKEFRRVEAELEAQLGRSPDERELADGLGVNIDRLRNTLGHFVFSAVMELDGPITSDGDTGVLSDLVPGVHDDPAEDFDVHLVRDHLEMVLDGLSDRERIVFTLYYFEGMPLAEIGRVMGVTESRICQIHTKAIQDTRFALFNTLAA